MTKFVFILVTFLLVSLGIINDTAQRKCKELGNSYEQCSVLTK